MPRFRSRYRVIIFDHRCFGRSICPPEAFDREHFDNDLLAILDGLGIDKAHIVGLSMGGFAALHFGFHFAGGRGEVVVHEGEDHEPAGAGPYESTEAVIVTKGAGLGEKNDFDFTQQVHVIGAFEEDAIGRSGSDPAKIAQRNGDQQGAGAGNDQKDEAAIEPVCEDVFCHKYSRQQQNCQRQEDDDRRVYFGEAGDEALCGGFAGCGFLDELEGFGESRVFKFVTDPYLDRLALVDGHMK